MKKPVVVLPSLSQLPASLGRGKTLKAFPRLAELVEDGAWEDGDAKGDRCWMVFVSRSGLVRVLVKVESPALKLSATGRSIDEAHASLDALLGGADVPWEQDEGQPRRKGKK